MFNFTTTTVINSQQDYSTGLPLWSLQKKTLADGKETTTLNIKRLHNFNKDNVVAIYKAVGNRPELAKVQISLGDLGANQKDLFRLNIYIGLTQASQDSRYSNDMIYKGKPFFIDFIWKGTAAQVAENLVKNIKKYQLTTYGDKLFNITNSGEDLVIEATNEFQRFKKIDIQLIDTQAYGGFGDEETIKSLEDLTEVDDVTTVASDNYFVGKEAFADYNYIMRNLRLPTSARSDAFAINKEENPIPGALYNQYTIHYCANRGQLGLNAVGHVVKSLTTHVLFVNQDLIDKTPDGQLPEDTDTSEWSTATIENALAAIAPDGELIEVQD